MTTRSSRRRTGLLYDQKGRRGTAMEYIAGRPGPYPEFGAPEGLVRGTSREGPVFPRTTWPSLGAMYLATLGITAALRARETTGEGQWVETSLLQGALAAVCLNWQRVENPDAPLYWMWPIDARSIEGLYRVLGRSVGAPLDRAAELAAHLGGGRRARLGGPRDRLSRRSRPDLDGARRPVDRHVPSSPAGRGVPEVPVAGVGSGRCAGRNRCRLGAIARRGARRPVVPGRRVRRPCR